MGNSADNQFEEGFTAENDLFGRKELYTQMMRVMNHSGESNLVVALDDEWGNGKTSFIKMLENEVNKNNNEFRAIYFDAFNNDYQSDAFLALTSHIYKLLEHETSLPKNLKDKFIRYSTKVGASILTSSSKYLIGVATGGVLSGSAIESASDKISEALSSPLEEVISEKIKSLEEEKNTLIHFKETLTDIYKKTNKKHIFIIDELDRARPDFSLALLEKVKHIFSTEGWIFILVLSRTQFQKSIEQQYGYINSKVYLNKFIHYWFSLPKRSEFEREVQQGYTTSTISKYLTRLDSNKKILSQGGYLIQTLALLLEANSCSLRETERCYSLLAILTNIEKANSYIPVYQVATSLCAFLKVHNNELLNKIHLRSIDMTSIITELKIPKQYNSHEIYPYLLEMINFHLLSQEERRAEIDKGNYPNYTNYGRISLPLESLPKEISMLHLNFN
ncbi:KAP family P-loop NTPase fold protein [Erwinia sp. LJJL01]|uniref:KAP family P-loop NTPase fold protein n=1 Tax=Erwinia sp. LJJL01 TaxID=3391839 RepID=UPI0010DDC00F